MPKDIAIELLTCKNCGLDYGEFHVLEEDGIRFDEGTILCEACKDAEIMRIRIADEISGKDAAELLALIGMIMEKKHGT